MIQKLSKEATRIFMAILKQIPEGDTAVKINVNGEQPAFMPLCVDQLYTGLKMPHGTATVYSLAHFNRQNGDSMRDPDVTFAVVDNRTPEYPVVEMIGIYPLSFQQDSLGIYCEHVEIDNLEAVRINKGQRDCATFCNGWLRNIRFQQNIKPEPIPDVLKWMTDKTKAKKAS